MNTIIVIFIIHIKPKPKYGMKIGKYLRKYRMDNGYSQDTWQMY